MNAMTLGRTPLRGLPFAAALLAAGLAAPAHANDAFAEFGVGGLTIGKTDKISMESEKLLLTAERVEVEYEFLSLSSQDEKVTVAFPLPPVRVCTEAQEPSGHCQDDEVLGLKFETWIDGKKAAPARTVERSWVGGKDVSPVLQKHGLTRDRYLQQVAGLGEPARAELRAAGLPYGANDELEDPMWDVQKVFYWEQTFKKGQRVTVRHQYRPIAGAAQGNPLEPEHGQKFCIEEGTRAALAQRARKLQKPNTPNVHRWIRYVLTSANSWAGPIRSFQLTIRKADPAEVVSTCFPGLRKQDARTFVAERKDFFPLADVDVLFF